MCKSCIEESIEIGLHKSCVLIVVVFCNGLHLLQREVSFMRGEDFTYLGIRTNVEIGIVLF